MVIDINPEFGCELVLVVPYVHHLHKNGKDVKQFLLVLKYIGPLNQQKMLYGLHIIHHIPFRELKNYLEMIKLLVILIKKTQFI